MIAPSINAMRTWDSVIDMATGWGARYPVSSPRSPAPAALQPLDDAALEADACHHAVHDGLGGLA